VITAFLSRDREYWFGDTHEKIVRAAHPDIPADEMIPSHGGLHRKTDYSDESFEHLLRAGSHPWSRYDNPNIYVEEWRFRKASDSEVEAMFALVKHDWDGKLYRASQVLGMLSRYAWLRANAWHKMRMTARGVCTEILWWASRYLYGEYSEHLTQWGRENRCYKDGFGPWEGSRLYRSAPELYERVR